MVKLFFKLLTYTKPAGLNALIKHFVSIVYTTISLYTFDKKLSISIDKKITIFYTSNLILVFVIPWYL